MKVETRLKGNHLPRHLYLKWLVNCFVVCLMVCYWFTMQSDNDFQNLDSNTCNYNYSEMKQTSKSMNTSFQIILYLCQAEKENIETKDSKEVTSLQTVNLVITTCPPLV